MEFKLNVFIPAPYPLEPYCNIKDYLSYSSVMYLPDLKTSLGLLRKTGTPIHIVRHCVKVAQVSLYLGRELKKTGLDISLDLLLAGGLLHDVAKYESIKNGGDHAKMGAEFLKKLGYPEVADIVRSHVHLDCPSEAVKKISEEILVNYADKRVKHTDVVSLEERFIDLQARYGLDDIRRQRINELYLQSKEMEQTIFSRLEIAPDDLTRIFRRR